MLGDARANFAYSTVATAPSPPTSGATLTVASGDGAKFAAPGQATIWPSGANPLTTNAEIVRVIGISGDVLAIVRAQEGSTARAVLAGDQIAMTVTAEVIRSGERAVFLLMGG